ncbi:MAG: family 20 glycosylhydrolase [Candidatus Omnitrophica bacterium]|nr:family 20 glycosylhydrolase [Candidatus Omnitrophota bacterium]
MIFSEKNKLPLWRREISIPAIKNRFFHIDLKGPKIPFNVFSSLLQQIARWGINGVVVEYEHRIPYLVLSEQFPRHQRYTESQIKFLLEEAKSLGIEWVPLVQTFGHVEYLSRLKTTENLFENPKYPSQLCPSNSYVRKYIEELIDYVCYLHPESKYIHIGQDETRQLGLCDVCSKRMKKIGGKIELYLEHFMFVCDQVFKRGRIPVAWADMLIGNGRFDLIRKIDKRVVLIPWDYSSIGKTSKFVIYKGFRPSKKQFYNRYTDPEPILDFPDSGKFFEDLGSKEIKNIVMDEESGYPVSFAQVRLLAKTKRPLWAASGLYMSADMQLHANFVRGVLNPLGMCDILISLGGEGVLGTLWARGHSFAPVNAPWTTVLYNLVQFARVSYSGETKPEHFRKNAREIARELDMPEIYAGCWTFDDICWIISSASSRGKTTTIANVIDILEKENVSGCFGEGLALCLKAEYLQSMVRSVLDEARWWYSTRNEMPSDLKNGMKSRFLDASKESEKLKRHLQDYYLKWIGDKESFSLWWDNLFNLDMLLAKDVMKMFR